MFTRSMKFFVPIGLSIVAAAGAAVAASAPDIPGRTFLEQHCFECHDADSKKGDLDLTSFKFSLNDPKAFSEWVKVYDRVSTGEMPPKKKARPAAEELQAFTNAMASALIKADEARIAQEGRATRRRLNRYEYENAIRDLLHAPWLQVRDSLPEDGEAHRFNKVGDALQVSHVQMARYLQAADYSLREAMATQATRPETKTTRYYARDQRSFTGPMKFSVFNTAPDCTWSVMFPELFSSILPVRTRVLNDPMIGAIRSDAAPEMCARTSVPTGADDVSIGV